MEMTLIRRYIDAMQNGDSVALSKIFSPDGVYCDFCPEVTGEPKYYCYGPEGIDMFFRNRFIFRRFAITEAMIDSDTQAHYVGIYGQYHLRSIATIQEFDENGLIRRLVVRPA